MLSRNTIKLGLNLCTYQQHRVRICRLNSYSYCLHLETNFQTAIVVKRFKVPPRLPESATQEQINESVHTHDYQSFRYEIVKETDAEPCDIKVILLKSSEGKESEPFFVLFLF